MWSTEDGKTKKELVGDDYTEAIERKVELNEQREAATV